MKLRIDYTKKGSEEVIDRLSDYIEKWRIRKMRIHRNSAPVSREIRKRNTHRIDVPESAVSPVISKNRSEKSSDLIETSGTQEFGERPILWQIRSGKYSHGGIHRRMCCRPALV